MKLQPNIKSLLLPPPQPLEFYDRIVVAFSGGKDSLACLLYLLALGVEPQKIELHHHEVDGREGSTLFDWPVTPAYCRAVAKEFGIPLYFSWKVGGLEGEMNRNNAPTAPTKWERPDGTIAMGGGNGKPNTRLHYPMAIGDLKRRWCSATAKIQVMDMILANDDRFKNSTTLIITGERGEESPKREKYLEFEPHRADLRGSVKLRRHIDVWRPVLRWRRGSVWDIIEAFSVHAHPAYYLGFGRLSCMTCIFASANQLATVNYIAPQSVNAHADYEIKFDSTVKTKKADEPVVGHPLSIPELVKAGTIYPNLDPAYIEPALSTDYYLPLILPPGQWKLPAGAFGENTGPS